MNAEESPTSKLPTIRSAAATATIQPKAVPRWRGIFSSSLLCETLAESLRWLEHAVLPVEADHIARALKYRAAFLAPAKVLIHGGAQIWGDFAVEVIRNLVATPARRSLPWLGPLCE